MHIEHTEGLDAEQRVVHDRLALLVRDTEQADRFYDEIAETQGGRVVSVDAARYLLPEFRNREFRIRHSPSTATPAGAYAHDRLVRTLASGPRTPGATLFMLAGGAGSGKTSFLGGAVAPGIELVFDNQMLNLERGGQLLSLARDRGWQTLVIFVFPPFELVVPGVIRRSVQTGRWNRLAELPRMHMQAQDTFYRLWQDYGTGGMIGFGVMGNMGTPESPGRLVQLQPTDLTPGEPRRYKDVQSLEEIVDAEIRSAIREGRFPEPVRSLCAPDHRG